MAYAVKYVFTFQSAGGTTREIRILKDGYSGDPIRRALGRAPILKKQQNGPVHGTSLEMYAECHVDQEFIEFYTSDPKEYRVDLYAGNTLLWQGWITPELYSEPDIAPPYDVQVVATDGVGELKLYDFAAQGMVSLRAMLTYLLGKTGLSTDVFLVSSLKAGSAGAGALLDMEANFDYLVGKTCYEALSYLLTTLHATITWWGGHWLLVRENNVTFTSGKVRYFNTAGNSALLANSVQVLGSMYQDPAWPVGQLSTVIDPAKNKIVVQAPWHPVTALKNSDMTQDSDWGKILVTYDSTKGAYFFPRDVFTAGELYQGVAFGGLRVPLRLAMSGCGTSETGSGFFGQGNGWLGLVLRFVDGSNNVYYLGTDGDGNRRWEQATPGQTPVRAFKQDLLSVDVGRENADRIELDIPALAVGGTFPAGTLTVSIYGGAAYLFSAQLDVILNKGYQDILRIDNGARGEGDDTEVAFGRVTSDVAYYQAFIQGILLNDGALITAFSDANFTTGLDFLSFISRDYARSVALPRARVEGTVSLEASVQLPPLVFTKDGLDYWLDTWSWNLYEDELQISARTLPTATLTVESETITEAGGTASTGSSAGGASQVPAVGLNYFEPNEDRASLIQLKAAYDYLGPRKGLIFGRSSSEDVNVDLEVVNIAGAGEEPVYALHSKLPFYSDSFVSAGGISDGPGSTGIDLAAMWASLQNTGADHTYDSYLIASAHIPDMSSVYGYLKQADIDPILALIPAQASATNQLADKAFVNSSIATATATYRGNYNEYSDLNLNPSATHAQVATALASEISVADANDYCFVEIPTSASTPTQIERTERYKYNGTGWEYEYTLNNSGFTAVQWAAINSNITADKVSAYDTLAGYFSNGVLDTSHLPALYIGDAQVKFSAQTAQDVGGLGNLTMANATFLRAYNTARDTLYNLAGLNASNYGYLGAANSPRTYMRGKSLYFLSGDSGNTSALVISTSQNATFYGALYLQNNKQIYWKNKPAEGAGDISIGLLNLTSSNVFTLGSGLIATGDNARAYNTYIYGASLSFYTGNSTNGATRRWMINSSGSLYPYADKSYNLGAAANYIKEVYAKKVYLAANTYLEVDSNGYVHLVTPSGKGFYCDGFISAGGLSSGGGSAGVDLAAVWGSLIENAGEGYGKRIHTAHLPDVTITGQNVTGSASYSGTGGASSALTLTINVPTAVTSLGGKTGDITLGSGLSIDSNKVLSNSGVRSVSVSGDYLRVNTGGTNADLTVPYATNVVRFKRYEGTLNVEGGYDLNTLLAGGGITSQYNQSTTWGNAPTNMSFGGAVQLNPLSAQTLAMQLAWDVDHANVKTGHLWWRDSIYKNSTHTWGEWHLIYDDTTLTKSVITGLLDAGNGTYLKLSGGTMSGNITIPNGNAIVAASTNWMLGISAAGTVFYCGSGYEISNGFLLRSGNINLVHRKFTAASTYNDYAIWDASIAYISSSAVTMGTNTVGSSDSPIGYATQSRRPWAVAGTQEAGGFDLNTILAGGGATRNVYNSNYWAHAPAGATYFGMAWQLNPTSVEAGSMQFFWDGDYNSTTAPTGRLFWRLRNNTGWADDWHRIYDSANANLSTVDWACKDLNAAGKVNVGGPSSTPAAVNVAGTIWASTGIWSDGYVSAGGVSSSSDARLKDNIKDFNYSAELLMSLKPREWDWNGKTTMVGHSAGFVAQEVEPHLPYAVTERTYKQLTYDIFHALEVSALQDHDTRIKALEDENRKKDVKIADLEKEIKRLRAL